MWSVPTLTVRSPADGRTVADAPAHTAPQVRAAARRLREAQPEWEELGPKERARFVERLRDWVLDNEPELTELLREETGKVHADASLEVMAIVDVMAYFAGKAPSAMADERHLPHGPLTLTKELRVSRRPHPLVGVITPWNFPLVLPVMDCVPALLAGAAVLLKPSELTPLTVGRLVSAWGEEVGAPPVFEMVAGGAKAGEAVVDSADYVQFTGSTETGRAIARRAAERLIPYGLELGGKDPMLVLDGAPVERAANAAAWGGLFNSGQVCVGVERVYAVDAVHDEFLDRLVDRVDSLRQGTGGPGSSDPCDVGAMANETQVDLVEQHVEDAVERGARVLSGGRRGKGAGHYFEPTVLADVTHDMAVMRDETFGPVVPVMRVADEEEAVELANDSSFGLSASVWCASHRDGHRVARRLEVGAVNVNDVFTNLFALGLPMAGWKESGLGARLGGEGAIHKYCRTQAVTASRLTPGSEIAWYPYSAAKSAITSGVVRLTGGSGLRRRLPF